VLGAEVNRPLPLAHSALVMAAAVRGGQVPGVIMHTDQRSEGGFNRSSQHRLVVRSTGAAARCVLVGAKLPGAVRVAEVDLNAGVDAQLRVAGHLRAWPGDFWPDRCGVVLNRTTARPVQ